MCICTRFRQTSQSQIHLLALFVSIRVVHIRFTIVISLSRFFLGASFNRSSNRNCRRSDFVIYMPSPTFNCAAEYDCGAEIDGGDDGYIRHYVSKFDTLAGVAIKYGVEVSEF